MSTPNTVPSAETPAGPMSIDTFLETYGEDALEETASTPENAAPVNGSATPESSPTGPQSPPKGEETPDDSPLDAATLDATLEALGLTPKDSPTPSDAPQQPQDGTEQTPTVDLSALASTLGISPEDLAFENGQVKLTTKVDGERTQVPIEELRKGYQLQAHFTRQNEEFLQQKQQWEAAQQAAQQQVDQNLAIARDVLDDEEKTLNAQYTKDWSQLRQDDPAEYAAQTAEYNQRLTQVRNRKQQLESARQERNAEQKRQYDQQVAWLKDQGQKYLSDKLAWRNDADLQTGGAKIRSYMQSSDVGYHPDEVTSMLDPRVLVGFDKARQWDELQAKLAKTRKAVSAAHKVPAGSPSTPEGGKEQGIRQAKERLAKTHSVEDAANLFKRMGVV